MSGPNTCNSCNSTEFEAELVAALEAELPKINDIAAQTDEDLENVVIEK